MADELTTRLEAAVDLVLRIASGDIDARGELSGNADSLDALVSALNMLAEDLRVESVARGRAEALLADERAAYEDAPGLFCSVELERLTIVRCNRTLARAAKRTKEELIGAPVRSLWGDEDGDALVRFLCGLAPGASPATLGRELRLGAGDDARVVAVSATRIEDESGGRARVVLQDVTASVKLQRERDDLERQFHQAQKMEAIGRLAGGVAHDFNNALTSIKLNTELLLRGRSVDDGGRRSVEQIAQATDHAASLTRQLLTFSRKQVLEPKVVDLDELVERLKALLTRLIGQDIALRTRLPPDGARVKADPGQLEQVLLNLVINARDAMPDGGELSIEVAHRDLDDAYCAHHPGTSPGPHVMLAVSDSGHGMDRETRERIFEPFFSTKTHGKGTGLGLATVFGIVAQNGGSIDVYSEPGEGSTFRVFLPASDEPIRQPSHAGGLPAREGRETLLFVEDDELVREVAVHGLETLGYSVLVASGGAEAIELAAAHDGVIDLLLTDVVMPKMNGRALAEALVATRPELRVLYVSGFTENLLADQGKLEAGVHFVSKPYSLHALSARVREVLDGEA